MINLFPKLAIKNKSLIEQSKVVGCYCCCKVLESKEAINYTDNGQTGLCPFCFCDCLVGDSCGVSIDEKILEKARNFWIGG